MASLESRFSSSFGIDSGKHAALRRSCAEIIVEEYLYCDNK